MTSWLHGFMASWLHGFLIQAFQRGKGAVSVRQSIEVIAWAVVLIALLVSGGILLYEKGKADSQKLKPLVVQPVERKPRAQPLLKVHVKGAVLAPGVYAFAPGARIEDAVRKAKPKPFADLNQLNLAAPLQDGDEIIVPDKRQRALGEFAGMLERSNAGKPSSLPAFKPPSVKAAVLPPGFKVRLNHATAQQLEMLPGIGPALAQRIVDYRRKIGRFTSIDQLLEVDGIGEKKLERMRPYLSL